MDHLKSALSVTLAQRSEKGVKPENQDTIGARVPEGNLLTSKGIAFAIADGVSSSASAQQASQTAVTGFLTDYYATPDTWSTRQSALTVIQSLNRYLFARSRNNVNQEGYLTTFSCLIFKGDSCFIFHVGDTRIYRLRGETLELLTRDHVQQIDKTTQYLSRALGADSGIEIDMHSDLVHPGDIYLLTSDGLHETLTQQQFTALVTQSNHPELLVDTAMDTAIRNGSADNISIQVVRVDAVGTPSQSETIAVLSQLPFPPPLDKGQIIDGYRVEAIIHESERSQVYLVCDGSQKRCIMKTPSLNYHDDPAYIERFVMESWIGARIHSPHVVRVIHSPQERSFLYYLTEHIAGPSLSQIIKQRAPLDISDAVELIEGVIKGVRAFHRRDTLHQDIKPDNIILGAQGPVLIDFGSCYVAGLEEVGRPFTRDNILGTLDYSAPEYRYGGTIGQASEQFSIATLLYEMLTGKHPYGERYRDAFQLKAFQKLTYIPARQYNPLVPYWLDKTLQKSLSIFPQTRYTSLSEWLIDLKRPNPVWLTHQERPLLERDPLLFWKILAGIGWAGFFYLLSERLA